MPNGYTAAIEDRDVSFEEFVWTCARGMDALIMMRDDSLNTPIPKRFEPSDHYQKALQQDRMKLIAIEGMTPEEIKKQAKDDFDREMKSWQESIDRKSKLKLRYERMLAKVEEWQPPSKDHEGLKKLMIDQLKQSIDWDCDDSYYQDNVPQLKTPAVWKKEQMGSLQHDIEYHERQHKEEVERTEGRNEWIEQLRNSVPQPKRIGK